ncbi:EndoU domain-containing protein, partial [Brevibacillus parabrevis]
EGTGNVPPVIKTFNISEEALDHANIGDFTKNPRTGAIQKMSGGGHGQDNIDFLEQNGIEYNIETTFPNGVRIGNVPEHKSKGKRTGTGQAWFPSNWNKEDIRRAGEYVANLPQNQGIADGVGVFGNYNGVRVGVIKTNGEIGTVFPDNSMQP